MAKKKSETRVAFEKKFAAERKKHGGDGGVFTFRGKKYTTDYAKKYKDKKKDSGHTFEYRKDSEHMKKHHTTDYTKRNWSRKKKKLGGFRDTFLEPNIENLD